MDEDHSLCFETCCLPYPETPMLPDTVILTPEERERINLELMQEYLERLESGREEEGAQDCAADEPASAD